MFLWGYLISRILPTASWKKVFYTWTLYPLFLP